MEDGLQLSRAMLYSLLAKEKNVALTPAVYQKFSVNSSLTLSSGDISSSVNSLNNNSVTDEYTTTASQRDKEVAWIISMGREFKIGIKTL
jgi:hypothetical protein